MTGGKINGNWKEPKNGRGAEMVRRKRRSVIAAGLLAAILFAAAILGCFYLSGFDLDTASALNSSNSANAYMVSDSGKGDALTEAWDESTTSFNEDVMADLITAISPATSDLESWLNTQTGKVANAEAIRTNVKANTTKTQGVLFRMNKIDWMVSYLTLVNIDGNDTVVATLYATGPITTAKFHSSNMSNYVDADIRTTIKNNASLALFKDDTSKEDDFSDLYIVKPDKIDWQKTGQANTQYNAYVDKAENHNGTAAWKDDTVWLPSQYEINSTAGKYETATGLWALSTEQKGFDTSVASYSWLRSASPSNNAFLVYSSGGHNGSLASYNFGLRPALHLNLTSAALGAAGAPKDPDDTTTTEYDGTDQTLVTLNNAGNAPKWYKTKYYEGMTDAVSGEDKNHGGTVNYQGGERRMNISYYTASGAQVTTAPHDADVYWGRVEIAEGWQNEENAKADAAGREAKTIKFDGTPDTTDLNHPESDTVRWFKFTIDPKPIEVTAPSYNTTTMALTMPTYSKSDCYENTGLPFAAVRITDSAGKYDKIITDPTSSDMPNTRGDYTATAVFVNSETDKTAYDGNYKIKTSKSCTFSISRTRVPQLSISGQNKVEYNGDTQEFILNNYNSDWLTLAKLDLPSGVTLIGDDASGYKLRAKTVDTYTMTCTLIDTYNNCWYVGGSESTNAQTFDITIEPKSLSVHFNSSASSFEIRKDDAQTISYSTTGVCDGDNVSLSFTYKLKGSSSDITVTGGSINCATLAVGEYVASVSLDGAKGDNGNYKISGGSVTQNFKILKKGITVDSVSWQWSQNSGTPTAVPSSAGTQSVPYEVQYNGREYKFEVAGSLPNGTAFDTSASGFNGGYKNSAFTNYQANAYEVTVRLVPTGDYEFVDAGGTTLTTQYKELKLYVKVLQAKYDLSTLSWSDDSFEYDGSYRTVTLKGLGENALLSLTVGNNDYTGNSYQNAGNYTASVIRFTNGNSNYITPVSTNTDSYTGSFEWSHSWQITQKTIPLIWETPDYTDKNGGVFGFPQIKDYHSHIDYSYQSADDSFNATGSITKADICLVEGVMTRYLVTAAVKSSSQNNYVLATDGENPFKLTIGQTKTKIIVTLASNSATYNGQAQGVTLQIADESGNSTELTQNDFGIAYYLASDTSLSTDLGAPVNAGAYKVVVRLTGNTNWYFIQDGSAKFDYTVQRATLPFDGVHWDYSDPFVFTYENGAKTEFSVVLVDGEDNPLDVALYGLVYSNNTRSDVGQSTASVTFNVDTNNYEPVDTSSVASTLQFTVERREFSKPSAKNAEILFSGNTLAIIDEINFGEGWENYFDVKYTANDNATNGQMTDAATYKATFSIKDGINTDIITNVSFENEDTRAKTVTIKILPQTLTVTGWKGSILKPIITNSEGSAADPAFYSVSYTDAQGASVSNINNAPAGTYVARVSVAAGVNPQNVVIVCADGVNDFKEFILFDDSEPPYVIDVSNLKKASVEYSGKPYTFKWADFGGNEDDAKYVEFSGSRTIEGVGSGTVTIVVKPTEYAEFSNGADSLTLNVEVVKGKVSADWDKSLNPPVLNLAAAHKKMVEYKYYDEIGDEVSSFTEGETYTVSAVLLDEYRNLYGFFEDGEYVNSLTTSFTVKALVSVEVPTFKDGGTLEYDGDAHTFELEFAADTAQYVDVIGSLTRTNADTYSVTLRLKAGAIWSDGSTDDKTVTYEITKKRLDSDWNTDGDTPTLVVADLPADAVTYVFYDENGKETTKLSAGGNYRVVARLTSKYSQNYGFGEALEFETSEFEFVPDKDIKIKSGNESFIDKLKDLIDSGFPLWQIVTMAVGGLLAVIFAIKTAQYVSRKNKLVKNAKKGGLKVAGLLPVFSSEVVLAGLSNQIWSIMAFAFAGFAVIMFIVALITRKAWKKAELKYGGDSGEGSQLNQIMQALQTGNALVPSAQSADSLALIAEMRREMEEREERYRRDEETRRREEEARRREEEARHREEIEALREEQSKRDDAMKMMLARMMGKNVDEDGDMNYYGAVDDTDLLVQKVIAGLLPAVQQMMPESTAYLSAPAYEQSASDIEAIADKVAEKLGANLPLSDENNEKYDALLDEVKDLKKQLVEAQSDANDENYRALTDQIAELQEQLSNNSDTLEDDRYDELLDEMKNLKKQIAKGADVSVDVDDLAKRVAEQMTPSQVNVNLDEIVSKVTEKVNSNNTTIVQDVSDEKMQDVFNRMAQMQQKIDDMAFMSVDELDDDDFDDEEEWDSILDEDDDDNFVESVIIEADGTVRKISPNFRMRLKESSDKNREWYAAIKNLFCSQKGVTYRVCKRVEKIRYQGQVIGVIGIAKRSIKLWLALKPYEYDARRYHHKDVSDKPRFVDVPLYVRVGSDRALTRAEELILALFQDFNMEARKRYTDRSIQELIFTLKHNRLLTNKQYKHNLCENMHVHDCDVLDDETAEKCIETKNVDFIDDSIIATVKLDDIDAKFQDGNRVTLEKLRKLGLVSADCTGYTVTADKRLTKPLIIVANDFTLTAVKLIALTGGRAIRLTQV
ncbi:MAG: uL15 family ribosomal protein [Bacteroides sp.]|nr:uL15 family ribosomal protein [Bacillota bacterium]MCM1394231.1 uL15 family ribosomal protein [[Eubacterium] siraeum]MCM1455986.1 uL15 family ribosomal protein [Bacteroides sp.]